MDDAQTLADHGDSSDGQFMHPASDPTLTSGTRMQVYSEGSLECRTAAPVWEALWKHMSSGGGDEVWARMGRVHWRTQRHLVYW